MMTPALRILVVLVTLVGIAHADAPTPWASGVSSDHQERANAIFADANVLFAQQAYPAALERYEAAIRLWDHPQIRYNMAITLIRLDRDLEAVEALEAALRFGAEPFTDQVYRRGVAYRRDLKKRIGELEVTCTQDGVNVSLDGQPWFSCPGTQRRRVTSGKHAVVAEGAGLMTVARRLAVGGGAVATATLKLSPLARRVVIEEERPRRAPWIVASLGIASTAAGAGTWFLGYRGQADADRTIDKLCAAGCPADSPAYLAATKAREQAEQRTKIGAGLMIGGGVFVVGGLVWALTGRSERRRPSVDITPTAEGVRATVGWQF